MLRKRKGILIKFSQTRTFKGIALCLALNILAEIVQPTAALALTEGPSQPEVQSFEPIGTTQMVDLFTGDFNYNIPLFNLPGPNGGYPVNIAYHAGASMDDEASWVGLGWNLNVGSLVRNMRGLPDEFLSVKESKRVADSTYDYLEVKSDMKKSWTLGASLSWPEVEILGANPQLSYNGSLYYNNYKGVGLGFGADIAGIGKNGNFSMGLSLDSENGLGVSVSLRQDENANCVMNKHKLSLDFNGDLSVGYSLTKQTRKFDHIASEFYDSSSSFGNSMSFASAAFSPSIGNKMRYYSFTAGFALGAGPSPATFLSNPYLSVFFNTQDIDNDDKKGRRIPVVGYDHLGDEFLSNDKYFTRDYSRQRDGQITKGNVILPNSYYTYDTYTSTGQGLSGFFRPKRNDIGKTFDPFVRNTSWGLELGFEVGPGPSNFHFGTNIGGNVGWETQGAWADDYNPIADGYDDFKPSYSDGAYGNQENLYYQAHGEMNIQLDSDISYLGGLDLAEVKFVPKNSDDIAGGKRIIDENSIDFDNNAPGALNKKVRNTLIHTLSNNEVFNLGEFDISYYSANASLYSSPDQALNRTLRNDVSISNHKAGFKVLNEEGSYYTYGLPAYNLIETENLFTVEEPANASTVSQVVMGMDANDEEVDYKIGGSHKYIHKSTKSPYAHSYLLTSVLGADYVDKLNDGPSDDDLGYWVKFDYVQASGDYQWRAPYNNDLAQYHRNASYTSDDDKASYQYGEKELWYLARIETKSHIAVFVTESRYDNQEADGEYPSSTAPTTPDHGRVLKEIRIYEKTSFGPTATPLQTIKFNYGYELCNGIDNGSGGKLTLKSISFNSMGSTRGDLNKYEFDYAGVDLLNDGEKYPGINPYYSKNAYDAWGAYKPTDSDYDYNSHFPYVNQFNQEWHDGFGMYYDDPLDDIYESQQTKAKTKQMQDQFASAWCLTEIKLPSGGKINIDYESDDYGYVQHKTANQMFKIVSLGDYTEDNEVYTGGTEDFSVDADGSDEARRRVYFKLENPIPYSGDPSTDASEIYKHYVAPIIQDEEGKRNLYFKSRMRLVKGMGNNNDVWDYVSGYLPLEGSLTHDAGNQTVGYNYGVDPNTAIIDGVECHTIGFVTIQAAKKKNGNDFHKYHPMALAAWNYLQTDASELLNNPNSFNSDVAPNNDPFGSLIDILNIAPMIMSSFGAVRKYCKSKDMAKTIDLDKSCIRLASPDKIKYGGGHRVRNITISDEWSSDTQAQEETKEYGQHFDYTITEDNNIISSGVAQFEPQAGGDENALKYPVYFFGKSSVFTRNNLFAEAPINEDLFPGANVGYRKVTVQSINTKSQLESSTPTGRTAGVTVHEFYSAKEFPTLTSYTLLSEDQNTKDVFNVPIPIPFIGMIKRTYYHGTQAFLIETNDMHGKPKSVKTYEVNTSNSTDYELINNPISEVLHEYQCTTTNYQGETVYKLDNYVDVIPNDGSHTVSGAKRLMGVEVDLFTDQRMSKNFSQQAGLEWGIDVPLIAVLPSVWPSFTNVKSMFKTFVTNKVVHRSGILKRTKSRDIQSVNESEILAYDEKSGIPILSKIKNEFGDDFYNYNIPAYYHYDRMGHAYKNINFRFNTSIDPFTVDANGDAFIEIDGIGLTDYLVRGDELLVKYDDDLSPSVNNNYHKKAYFLGWAYSGTDIKAKIHIPNANNETTTTYGFKVIRSGRRNHYSTMAANYLTKGKLSDNLASTDYPLSGSIETPLIENPVVLSASASLYKDDWSASSMNITDPKDVFNPFINGNSGIWRPYKSYTYVGERTGAMDIETNIGGDPELYNDGTIDDVPMFSWEIGNMEEYVSNWEWVNEVTRFSTDAYELENMNRLNIYSSALYGYDNSLTIGVGGNASMHEIGTMDFEKSGTSDFNTLLKQTNLNFDNNHQPSGDNYLYLTEKFNIKVATSQATNKIIIETDIPYSYYTYLNGAGMLESNTFLELISNKSNGHPTNEGYFFNAKLRNEQDISGYTQLEAYPYIENENEPKNMLKDGGVYYGKITLLIKKPYLEGPTTVSYVDTKAHTGNQSMKVMSTTVFDQPKIKLVKDKSYVLSLWVSRDDTKVVSFDPSSLVSVGTMNGSTFVGSTPVDITVSKIIEGWQKIDLEFSVNLDQQIFAIKFLPGTTDLYVDDIRFSPKTGGINTYVYDADKFWLRAVLNVDNYATLFYYDEEGNLTIKKQETEEGVFTITESRGHVSEN